MSDSAAQDIRHSLTNALDLCDRLGLLVRGGFTRQARGVIVRCPWHEERTPSCSIRTAGDGTIAARCHGCGATGDALSLIAAVHGLTMRGDDFRQILILGAELAGLHTLVHELETGHQPTERRAPVPRAEPEPERDYPSTAEVDALWSATETMTAPDPKDPSNRVSVGDCGAWATSRGLDAETLEAMGLARALPAAGALPRWATYRGQTWRETGHRLLVPVYDHTGAMRSVRAIRVVDGDSPKRLPPAGHRAAGLVMACDIALGMLRGTFTPERVLVVEGEPDCLTWMTTRTRSPYAVIGITSGSWTVAFAARVPAAAKVYLLTHADPAGDKYAAAITATLPKNEIFRWTPKECAA